MILFVVFVLLTILYIYQPCPVRALCSSVRLVFVPVRLARSREGRSSHHPANGNSGCGLETGGQVGGCIYSQVINHHINLILDIIY